MKKNCIYLLFCFFPFLSAFSQGITSKFSFSGYRVVLIPADSFRINVINKFESKQEIKEDGTFSLMVLDQTGQVPKDTVYVYTNELRYLTLHNSELVMKTPYRVDSLNVDLYSAFGTLNVEADFLKIVATAGAKLSAKGNASFLDFVVGGGARVDAQNLEAKRAKIDVMGYSSLVIRAERIVEEKVEKSTFKNKY